MNLYEAQELAKDLDKMGKIHFDLVGSGGRKSCIWLDPWLGIFQFVGDQGFVMVNDFWGCPLTVENHRIE